MSGIKISVQEINRIQREQLALKAERVARENARRKEFQIGVECGLEILRAYVDELKTMLTDIDKFSVNDFERKYHAEQLEKWKGKGEALLDFYVVSDDEKGLEEYKSKITKFNEKVREELKTCYKALARWERKQEKLDIKNQKLQMLEEQVQKKLERKHEILKMEEKNEYKQTLQVLEEDYIHDAIEEAMAEIGCELVGIKGSETPKQEEVFSYEDGVAIHVIEQNCQITMEVVATDNISRKANETEQVLVERKMHDFEVQYMELQEILRRKGISPKSGSEMVLPPSKAMVKVENMSQYDTVFVESKDSQSKNHATSKRDYRKCKNHTRNLQMN